jgi:hypothetical protein
MVTVIQVDNALVAGAVETRGGWTWAYGSDQAAQSSWPAIAAFGGSALTPAGSFDLGQKTVGLDALGAGSARIDQAVKGDTAVRFSASGYPDPGTTPFQARLILRDDRTTGSATYFELQEAAQTITIRRNGTDLEVVSVDRTETVNIEPLLGAYMLVDLTVDFTNGFSLWVGGVDFTPSLTGGALTGYGGAAILNLLNNTAASDAAVNVELVFAGIAASGTLTIEQHREDARLCGVLADGLAIDGLTTWEWAWSTNRLDEDTEPYNLPGEPDYGTTNAGLAVSTTFETDQQTNNVRPEGLGRPRLNTALLPGATTDQAYRGTPSGFPVVDDDFHIRLIVKPSLAVGTADLFALEESAARLLKVGLVGDDLVLTATSAYALTFADVIKLDEWNLIDFSVDRDGAGGNAQMIALVNGADLGAAAHGSTITDIAVNATVALWGDFANTNGAANAAMVFGGIALGSTMALARHRVDALALGVL